MFNLKGRDRQAEARDAGKSALKPALYDPPGAAPRPAAAAVPRGSPLSSPPVRDSLLSPAPSLRDDVVHTSTAATWYAGSASASADAPGSKLSVGINIKLKGVEISDCDNFVIEGHVEAAVHSKSLEIAKPGTLKGNAEIDVAEVHGEFSGELTARKRLVVHGTGRVSGTIRYGQLIVAEGGELTGDVKRLDGTDKPAPSRASDSRHPSGTARDREPA